jgi:hypothetical protein
LDPEDNAKIELEFILSELSALLKKKRGRFVEFCEQKVYNVIKIFTIQENELLKKQQELEKIENSSTNPFKRYQKE